MTRKRKAISAVLLLVLFGLMVSSVLLVRPHVEITISREVSLERVGQLESAILDGEGFDTIVRIIDGDPSLVHAPSQLGYPIQHAVKARRYDVVRLLIEKGADVDVGSRSDEPGVAAIWFAVSDNDPEMVRILIDAGADLNVQGRWGGKPSEVAKERGYGEVEQLLLTAEAERRQKREPPE